MPKEAKDAKRESFEQLYTRLEESVNKLEQGGLPLEGAIALYEDGMTLARQCQERLDEADLKVTKLRESFAALPSRTQGGGTGEGGADYEYVDEDEPAAEDDPFE